MPEFDLGFNGEERPPPRLHISRVISYLNFELFLGLNFDILS